MKYYFKLQATRLFRWFDDKGLSPALGLAFGLLIFLVLSTLLFFKLDEAAWIYLFIASLFLYNLSEEKRNDTIKNIFSLNDYRKIRIVENGLMGLPFMLYLLFERENIIALLLLLLLLSLSLFSARQHLFKSIPTPFKRFSFEFIVGFRRTFLFIIFSYFLVIQAIAVGNYELGLFGLIEIYLVAMAFYQKPESKKFVRMYTCQPTEFIKTKLMSAVLCGFILSSIALILMLFAFPSNWLFTLLVFLVGNIMLCSMVLAKYSAYPYVMNIPQAILYLVSLMFPPLLIYTLWLFYSRSKKNLEPLLEC